MDHMIAILFASIISTSFASGVPKDSQGRFDALMEAWGEMTFERRDNFMSQIKGAAKNESYGGATITAKEFESLMKLSKQTSIPELKNLDTNKRPEDRSERRNIVQETCEKFKGNLYKRCEKKWFEIVEYTSEESDEISDPEWDDFMALVKKLKAELTKSK